MHNRRRPRPSSVTPGVCVGPNRRQPAPGPPLSALDWYCLRRAQYARLVPAGSRAAPSSRPTSARFYLPAQAGARPSPPRVGPAPPLLAPPRSPLLLPLCARAALALRPPPPPPPRSLPVSAVAAPGNMASEGMILTNHDHQIRVGVLTGNGPRPGTALGRGGRRPRVGARRQAAPRGAPVAVSCGAAAAAQGAAAPPCLREPRPRPGPGDRDVGAAAVRPPVRRRGACAGGRAALGAAAAGGRGSERAAGRRSPGDWPGSNPPGGEGARGWVSAEGDGGSRRGRASSKRGGAVSAKTFGKEGSGSLLPAQAAGRREPGLPSPGGGLSSLASGDAFERGTADTFRMTLSPPPPWSLLSGRGGGGCVCRCAFCWQREEGTYGGTAHSAWMIL